VLLTNSNARPLWPSDRTVIMMYLSYFYFCEGFCFVITTPIIIHTSYVFVNMYLWVMLALVNIISVLSGARYEIFTTVYAKIYFTYAY
jgi:hypothetical protein